MKLTRVQKLILYSLGQFYQSLNQPLTESPVKLRTSKITFIEHVLKSGIITKQERALYRNLETLENKRLVGYENRMIKFTDQGLKELSRIIQEIRHFVEIKKYFQEAEKPKRKLQTVING